MTEEIANPRLTILIELRTCNLGLLGNDSIRICFKFNESMHYVIYLINITYLDTYLSEIIVS